MSEVTDTIFGPVTFAVLLACCVAGCDKLSTHDGPVPAAENSSRYQFDRDEKGRLIRLDTHTGEATLVETLAPRKAETPAAQTIARQPTRNNSTVSAKADFGRTSRDEPLSRPGERDNVVPRISAPAKSASIHPEIPSGTPNSSTPTASADDCPESGRVTVVRAALEVFVEPEKTPTPMASLARGTELTILEPRGEWRLVRFNDPEWGQRAGFISCSP